MTLLTVLIKPNISFHPHQRSEICPAMHANMMHELYDRHNKMSPTLNSYQNTNNSVKHEVIWKRQKGRTTVSLETNPLSI